MALPATIPHLTHSSLHRLFQRHDVSRLPIETEEGLRLPDARTARVSLTAFVRL